MGANANASGKDWADTETLEGECPRASWRNLEHWKGEQISKQDEVLAWKQHVPTNGEHAIFTHDGCGHPEHRVNENRAGQQIDHSSAAAGAAEIDVLKTSSGGKTCDPDSNQPPVCSELLGTV
jgi:hypothetical protein